MNFIRFWLALLVLSATLCQCSRCKENVTPESVLPPETQTGANTFGCKINGKIWLPTKDGQLNYYKSLKIWYDPTFKGGSFTVNAYTFNGIHAEDNIGIAIDSVNTHLYSIYLLSNNRTSGTGIDYIKYKQDTLLNSICDNYYTYRSDKNFYLNGQINLKKFDSITGIAAGTFEFTAHVQGCDTLKITDGRFDLKF